MTKRPTLVVREVMKLFGKSPNIWTNKYKTMRSVKCYSGGKAKDARMMVVVEKALKKAGVKMISAGPSKFTHPGYGVITSFIVRLPLNA